MLAEGRRQHTRSHAGVYPMAFHVRGRATDTAVRALAKLKGKTLTETIREAVARLIAAPFRCSPSSSGCGVL